MNNEGLEKLVSETARQLRLMTIQSPDTNTMSVKFGNWFCPKAEKKIMELCLSPELREMVVGTQWISVKERLPEKEGLFLVFSKHKNNNANDSISKEYFDGKSFDYIFHEWKYTHWMPLPNPPISQPIKEGKMNENMKTIVQELEKKMRCDCDLDNWQPEESTGHSCVCRIHKEAIKVNRKDSQ